MDYRLLGPIEARRDGESVPVGTYKQRALLALLLINANAVVSTDRIIDELWGDEDGRDRQNSLWVTVSGLRSALEPDRQKRTDGTIVLTRMPGYVLATDTDAIDSARFEQLALEGRGLMDRDPSAASIVLSEALAQWRGHALEEFAYEAFAQAEIARLEEMRLATVEDRVEADLRSGRSRELIGELEGLVRQHPLRERLTGQLMLALHRAGRQPDALRAFGAFQTRLAEEMGLDPSAELAGLEERIVLGDPSLEAGSPPGSVPDSGHSVRGYELRDEIDRRDEAAIHVGYQPTIGREVTITRVDPTLANNAEFIREFERRAQRLARVDHPSVVPVIDYWREPGGAFLVTRRFEDGVLVDGPLDTASALRLLDQIGAALDALHSRGIVHGAIEPSVITLDGDGNAYLGGFAVRGDGTVLDDVRSFARLATGILGPDVPSAMLDLLVDAVSGEPDTPQTAGVLAGRLAEIAEDRSPVAPPVEVVNPYHGLRAFAEEDATTFFGRERLVERLLGRLGHAGPEANVVNLVGPSGSGKSSVVRAGVIPALRAGGLVGSDRWFIVTMTPGAHPFEALEDALFRIAVDPPPSVLESLTSQGVAATAAALLPGEESRLLVIVDQLEELFTQASPARADAFLAALAETASDRHSRVRILTTLRADFYDQPLRHSSFGELLRLGTEAITPMSPSELARAVEGPAETVGVVFEPGLVPRIVSDMTGQAAALPLLQYALTELFDRRSGRTVTSAAYEDLGGVSRALVRRADSILGAMAPEDHVRTREVFLRLVSLGEGTEDTRRRASVGELTAAVDGAQTVLDTFGRHRLLSFDRDSVTRDPTVELAHEALLREWARLRDWIDESRGDVAAQRRLQRAAEEWSERDGDPDYLLVGARLASYEDWASRPPVQLTPTEVDFLDASEERAEAARRAERRRLIRLRRLVTGTGVALVVALIAGGIALAQRNTAQRAVEQADLATLISRSAATSTDNPEVSILLALEAHRRAPSAETELAVLNALGRSPIGNRVGSVPLLFDEACSPAFVSADGLYQYATIDGALRVLDLASGDVTELGPSPTPCGAFLADLATGRRVVSALDGTRIWVDGGDGGWTVIDSVERESLVSRSVAENRILMASGLQDSATLTIRDATTGEAIGEPYRDIFWAFAAHAISSDGSRIAIGLASPATPEARGRVLIIDGDTGLELHRIPVSLPPIELIIDETTGELLALTDAGRLITIDLASAEVVSDIEASNPSRFFSAGIRPDGLVVAVSSGQVELIDRRRGATGTVLQLGDVFDARVRPDGTVVTLTSERTAESYDLAGTALVETTYPVDPFARIALGAGAAVVTGPPGQPVTRLDLATGGREQLELRMPDGAPPMVVFPEPGGLLAVGENLMLARFVDGVVVDSFDAGSRPDVIVGGAVAYTSTGVLLGRTLDGHRESNRLEAEGGLGVSLTVGNPGLLGSLPAPDGGLYITTQTGVLQRFDAAGALIDELDLGVPDLSLGAIDEGTGHLALAGAFGAVIVEPETGEFTVLPDIRALVGIAWVRSGSLLILSGGDGDVRLWDVERGESGDSSGTAPARSSSHHPGMTRAQIRCGSSVAGGS